MSWTLAQAKDQLSEVVRRATRMGPQTISVRGRETAVLIAKADYDRLQAPDRPASLKQVLMRMDLEGLNLSRDQTPARDIEF